jgi:hypothetical protein
MLNGQGFDTVIDENRAMVEWWLECKTEERRIYWSKNNLSSKNYVTPNYSPSVSSFNKPDFLLSSDKEHNCELCQYKRGFCSSIHNTFINMQQEITLLHPSLFNVREHDRNAAKYLQCSI